MRVKQESNVPAWDPDVRYYSVYDADQTWLGSFYADFFPRENKRGGAWMDELITGSPSDAIQQHLGLICGNLTPPIGDKPALLTHREVETISTSSGICFITCSVQLRSAAWRERAWPGTSSSCLRKSWRTGAGEREALDLFARHYETGRPIPEELFQK